MGVAEPLTEELPDSGSVRQGLLLGNVFWGVNLAREHPDDSAERLRVVTVDLTLDAGDVGSSAELAFPLQEPRKSP